MFHKNYPQYLVIVSTLATILATTIFATEKPKAVPHSELIKVKLALYDSEARHLQKAFSELQAAKQEIFSTACKDAGIPAEKCEASATEVKEKPETKPPATKK